MPSPWWRLRGWTGPARRPWFKALEAKGVVVNVYPVERARLPEWIAAALARQKQSAARDTLQFLADCVEGNLLAATRRSRSSRCCCPPGS